MQSARPPRTKAHALAIAVKFQNMMDERLLYETRDQRNKQVTHGKNDTEFCTRTLEVRSQWSGTFQSLRKSPVKHKCRTQSFSHTPSPETNSRQPVSRCHQHEGAHRRKKLDWIQTMGLTKGRDNGELESDSCQPGMGRTEVSKGDPPRTKWNRGII